ncbi:MAG: segregation/condensation protein A [Desulfobacterales bacterium]|jgi:segregation and condensation protein A
MENKLYQVKLSDIFEGPMDLLVHLIKKNEIDIYDIPIAMVTEQYLSYLEWLKSMNIDFAGDFLVMAATLAHIKSRMLLPTVSDEDDDEDPRMEIARPLAEYLQLKSAAEELSRRALLGENTFVRQPAEVRDLVPRDEEFINIGLFELIDAFQQILKNISAEERLELTSDSISVKDRISELVDLFEEKKSLTFEELFAGAPNKSDVIITFLAILEMVKLCLVRLAQHSQTGLIRLFYE